MNVKSKERTEIISFRCTPLEKQIITNMAKRADKTVSRFLLLSAYWFGRCFLGLPPQYLYNAE